MHCLVSCAQDTASCVHFLPPLCPVLVYHCKFHRRYGTQNTDSNLFIFPCPILLTGGQNLDQGGANAPPFTMPRSLINQGFSEHTRLTIGRGVQGCASLDCIKIGGKTDVLCVKMIQRQSLLCDVNPQFTRAFRGFLLWRLFVF